MAFNGANASAVCDPIRIAELALAAAIHADADAVFIEPSGSEYAITFERARQTLATASLDAATATAAIARLSYLANLDLASASPTSSLVAVRSGSRTLDIVVTIRPGSGLRADLTVMPPAGQPRPQATSAMRKGDIVGNYRIIDELGVGGMGAVFLVEHTALARRYALKVLKSTEFQRDRSAAHRFLREARAAARLRHPTIVDVFDFGILPDGRPYFVMELLVGPTVSELVRSGALQPRDAIVIGRQLALALATAHDAGVVHADVTPANVIVVSRAPLSIKLVDFGLSLMNDEPTFEMQEGFVLGTPKYISPEQLCGLPASDRSDQYSLGCVLYLMLVGRAPYEHKSTREVCRMHLHAPIPVIESPHGPLPPMLVDVVVTCMQKSPHQRFPGTRALVAALDEVEERTEAAGWRRWLA